MVVSWLAVPFRETGLSSLQVSSKYTLSLDLSVCGPIKACTVLFPASSQVGAKVLV